MTGPLLTVKDEKGASGKYEVEDTSDDALTDTDDLEVGGDVIPAAEDSKPDEENVANNHEHTRDNLQDQGDFNKSGFVISTLYLCVQHS